MANIIDRRRNFFARCRLRLTVYALVGIFAISGIRVAIGNDARIDYVVAVVNDQAITWSELPSELVISAFVNPSVPLLPPLLNKHRNPTREDQRTVLDTLIDRTLMLQEAERWGIPLARWDDKVADRIERFKKSYPSKSVFFETLKQAGIEYAELEEWIRTRLIIDNLIFRKFINSIDGEKIEQESLRHFEQYKSEYFQAARITFEYVLVPLSLDASLEEKSRVERLAEKIYLHLRNGMPIEEIQQFESGDANIKIAARTTHLDSELGSTIAALKTNRWSSPIPTPGGYLVANSHGAEKRRQKAYTEVKDEIQSMLIDKQVDEQIEKWLAKQKEIGNWHILDPALAQIEGRASRNKP